MSGYDDQSSKMHGKKLFQFEETFVNECATCSVGPCFVLFFFVKQQ